MGHLKNKFYNVKNQNLIINKNGKVTSLKNCSVSYIKRTCGIYVNAPSVTSEQSHLMINKELHQSKVKKVTDH